MLARIFLTLGLLAGLASASGTVLAQASKPTTPPPAAPARATELIDINTADKAKLMTLDGIGEARSDAIIKGRPYRAKNELVDKNILTQAVYDKIKDQIIARQPPAKK